MALVMPLGGEKSDLDSNSPDSGDPILPFPRNIDDFDFNRVYSEKGVKYQVDFDGATPRAAKAIWSRHQRVLVVPIERGPVNREQVTDVTGVAAWKHYWDLKSGKLESLVPLIVGVTVKSIQVKEDDVLVVKATITLKLPIDELFANEKSLLGDLRTEAKDFLEGIGLNFNKDNNQTLNARNFKLNKIKDGKFTDYSISDHLVSAVDSSGYVDCCPFNVAEYNLSIKLNALISDGDRGKVKLVWMSRTPSDFLQFQYTSLGSSVTPNDSICILPKFKREKDLNEFKSRSQSVNEKLRFDEVIGEVDELIISFHTKSNQIKNLTNIVLPCFMVPIIVALSNDRESKIQLLLAALLTMVFTMPAKFKFGTMIWYIGALVLTVIAFSIPGLQITIQWISLIVTGVFLILAFYFQRNHSRLNKISIRELVKDAAELSFIGKLSDYFGLD
jgi:hypothetical protein